MYLHGLFIKFYVMEEHLDLTMYDEDPIIPHIKSLGVFAIKDAGMDFLKINLHYNEVHR